MQEDSPRSSKHYACSGISLSFFILLPGSVKSRRRSATPQERSYLGYMRTLCSGMTVAVNYEDKKLEAEVLLVDRFKRTLTVAIDGREVNIHSSCLCVPSAISTSKTEKTVKRKKTGRVNSKADASCQVTVTDDCQSSDNFVNRFVSTSSHGSFVTDGFDFFSGGSDDKTVTVGDVGHVTVGGIGTANVGVERLFKEDSKGILLLNAFVLGDKEVKVTVPVHRFRGSNAIKLKDKEERSALRDSRERAFKRSFALCQESSSYRRQVREMQLSKYLRKEVKAALNSKGRRRVVNLGVCAMESDLEILGLEGFQKKDYSYRNNNIKDLDHLLGPRWDIIDEGNRVKFVTSLTLQLSVSWVETCSISTGISWNAIGNNYRKELLPC
ncbi:hypothetical protein HOLleu_21476 [Holothuria leucospilota]|uniref:Uncharacterized protein n=1 Tax=Holothuria leucospilota TaxID=206669 RepID=A0A9Q1BXC4_HOLLE|nr:hypothetical protein HOLleu_21476 [Holothuria leucospilota]